MASHQAARSPSEGSDKAIVLVRRDGLTGLDDYSRKMWAAVVVMDSQARSKHESGSNVCGLAGDANRLVQAFRSGVVETCSLDLGRPTAATTLSRSLHQLGSSPITNMLLMRYVSALPARAYLMCLLFSLKLILQVAT